MGGFTGTLLIGIFASSAVSGVQAGIHQFLIQLFGAVLVAIYSFVVTLIVLKIADATGTIRVSKETLEIGLDKVLLHEVFSVEE